MADTSVSRSATRGRKGSGASRSSRGAAEPVKGKTSTRGRGRGRGSANLKQMTLDSALGFRHTDRSVPHLYTVWNLYCFSRFLELALILLF